MLAALVFCILGQCSSIYVLFGEEIWRNLVMMPAPRQPLPHVSSASPAPSSASPSGTTSQKPDSLATAQPAPAPKAHLDILDVLWFVTMDDLMARHGGMLLKALTVIICPLISMKHRRVAQVRRRSLVKTALSRHARKPCAVGTPGPPAAVGSSP